MEALYGAGGAIVAAIVTFALTRGTQVRDGRAARLAAIEGSVRALRDELRDGTDDLRDDLVDAMRQLARHVPGFAYEPRRGRRRE